MCAYFWQWAERYPEGCRLTMVVGEDRTLVAEVLKKELEYRPISVLDYVVHNGTDPIGDILASLDQFSKGGMRVVVIHDSDKIRDWTRITDWTTSRLMRDTHLICVGNDIKPDTKLPHFRPFVERGRYIECRPLAEDKLLAYVMRDKLFTQDAAEMLLQRTGGSTAKILNEMKKLIYLPPPVTPDMVIEYVEVSESERFIDALFANDKMAAMKIANTLDAEQLPFIIGSLEYALSNLILLILVRDKQLTAVDISERTGIPMFLIGKYFLWGKGLTTNVAYKRLKLVANIDALTKRGHSTAVMERLICLW
jgi:DNA polymerase III delta subunit